MARGCMRQIIEDGNVDKLFFATKDSKVLNIPISVDFFLEFFKAFFFFFPKIEKKIFFSQN